VNVNHLFEGAALLEGTIECPEPTLLRGGTDLFETACDIDRLEVTAFACF